MIDGLLVVDKPAGWTSHDVVAKLRGATRQRRIGHAGTLDPDATGVLLVGLGRVTRLMRFLQETTKSYRGVISFGVATNTLDAAGEVLERAPMPVERAAVEAALPAFRGDILQVPPMVSALKVDGKRLHELAREGKVVERAPRSLRIDRFDIESFTGGDFPEATVIVDCTSGTYIRSLAADVGTALGGCAHLASLRRLRVGEFTIDDATPLETLIADPHPYVHTPAAAMRALAVVNVDDESRAAIANGKVFDRQQVPVEGDGPFAMIDTAGNLVAVYERSGERLKPSVVLPDPTPDSAPVASSSAAKETP